MTFTSRFLFITLLVVAFMVENTYKLGKASAPYLKKGVALLITLAILAGEGVTHLYNHRNHYLSQLNTIRNKVGEQFTYNTVALA